LKETCESNEQLNKKKKTNKNEVDEFQI